jgi:hypothetical protein
MPTPEREVTVHRPKITRLRVALATAGAALLVSLVPAPSRTAAEETTTTKKEKKSKMPSMPQMQRMKPMDVMHMMDPDKKGYVTHEEFMKFYEDLFQRLDRDKNGQLTQPEFTDEG